MAKPYLNGDSGGACIEFEFEGDKTVTLLRLGGNNDTLRFHVAVAKTTLRVNNNEEDRIISLQEERVGQDVDNSEKSGLISEKCNWTSLCNCVWGLHERIGIHVQFLMELNMFLIIERNLPLRYNKIVNNG